jgi:hypothetical protein
MDSQELPPLLLFERSSHLRRWSAIVAPSGYEQLEIASRTPQDTRSQRDNKYKEEKERESHDAGAQSSTRVLPLTSRHRQLMVHEPYQGRTSKRDSSSGTRGHEQTAESLNAKRSLQHDFHIRESLNTHQPSNVL